MVRFSHRARAYSKPEARAKGCALEVVLRTALLALSLLTACAPKSSPEDLAFERAQAVVAAFERGEAPPLPLDAALESNARAHAYMGEYLWEMYAATSAARAAVEPSIRDDPRWSGLAVAVPAPETDGCCFLVHFPARVDGEIRPWVVAKAGWDAVSDLSHNLGPTLPEPGVADAELATRVKLLVDASGKVVGDYQAPLVLAMGDLTQDPDDDDVWVYFIPSVSADEVGIGGIQAQVWEDRTKEPSTVTLGGPARTWPASAVAEGPGLFLEASGQAPNEAHIFASRRYELPLWVDLESGLWRVEGNGVGLYATKR